MKHHARIKIGLTLFIIFLCCTSSTWGANVSQNERNVGIPCRSQEIPIPADGDCLYKSIMLAYLLPVVGDADLFNARFVMLVGEDSIMVAQETKDDTGDENNDDNKYDNELWNPLQLRQHFLQLRRASLIYQLRQDPFPTLVRDMRRHMRIENNVWGGAQEIQTMANRLQVTIEEYTPDPDNAKQLTEPLCVPCEQGNPLLVLRIVQDNPTNEESIDTSQDWDLQVGQQASVQDAHHRQHYRALPTSIPAFFLNQNQGNFPALLLHKNNTHQLDDNNLNPFPSREENMNMNQEVHEEPKKTMQAKLTQRQVNGALKVALQANHNVYIIDDKDICGNCEKANKTIYHYVKQVIKKEKNHENLAYIGVSYAISPQHQVALLIQHPYKKNPQLIIIDSLGKDRTQEESIQDLAQKLGISTINKGQSNYHNRSTTSASWECGVHTFCNIVATVQGTRHAKPTQLALDNNLTQLLDYAFQYEQMEEKLDMERQRNGLEKSNLLKNIELLLQQQGGFDNPEAQDALRALADALQMDDFGNLNRENIIPTDQGFLTKQRKIDKIIKKYANKNKGEIMGIIILNALKTCGNLASASTFYENAFKSDALLMQDAKALKTKEDKLHNLGLVFDYLGKYEQSLRFYNQAAKIKKDKFGVNSVTYATTLHNIGLIYNNEGQYDNAITYYKQALDITEKTLGKENPSYNTMLNNIAGVYDNQGKYDNAIIHYNLALNICEQTLGKEHPEYANTLAGIAGVYKKQGKYDNAISHYNLALNICEKTIGKEHPEYANTLNNIAGVYRKQGKYDKAIKRCILAINIIEKAIGKEHPIYATTLNNIGLIYDHQGQYNGAIIHYYQALNIYEKTIGKQHPDYANTLNNIASVYKHQEQYDKAIIHYKLALNIYEKTIGKEHPIYAITLNSIALVYHSKGKYDNAIKYYKQTLNIKENTLGKQHPSYANTLNNIAAVYKNQGQHDEAIKHYKQILKIEEKAIGKEHPSYANTLNNIAKLYEHQGQYDNAITRYKQLLKIEEKTIDSQNLDYANILNNIARVYDQQGKYQNAITFYKQELNIYKNKLGKEHPSYANTLSS